MDLESPALGAHRNSEAPDRSSPLNSAVARQSLTEKVYQHLMLQLASRSLRLGEPISARLVAEELNVSRTTVNKAISQLDSAGWIKPDENRHPVVVAYPPKLKVHEEPTFEFANQTDSTYEVLLERILCGHYNLGEIIKERPVGQELGVNPATVRRAAEWLRNDGLLQRLPRRGWKVNALAAHDLKDVYQIRLLLEPMALDGAVNRVTDETLDDLEQDTDRLIALGEKATVYDRRQADHRFHQVLSENSGSTILAETLEPLIRKALLVTTVGYRYARAATSFEEHKEILKALRERDGKAATKQIKTHLRNALKFNLEHWERP